MGGTTSIVGAVLLLVGTLLHPSTAQPNNSVAAFTEYAAFQPWVAVHLLQLFGVVLIMAALVLLARRLTQGPAAEWATLAMTGAIASVAVYGALQAVDGVALKALVDSWVAAPEPDKAAVFQAALAVRHIEIGLSSIGDMLIGLTAALYGVALWIDGRAPRWLGALALVGGVPTAIAGVVIAYTGFSDLELTLNMVFNGLLLLWMIVLGLYAWRGAPFWRPPTLKE